MTSTDDTGEREDHTVVAFGLVCAAGASTALGASVVFVPALVQLTSRRVLASGLGVSAGVMIFLSFIEIVYKSRDAFVAAGNTPDEGFVYAIICFFLGVVLMVVLNATVRCFMKDGNSPKPRGRKRHNFFDDNDFDVYEADDEAEEHSRSSHCDGDHDVGLATFEDHHDRQSRQQRPQKPPKSSMIKKAKAARSHSSGTASPDSSEHDVCNPRQITKQRSKSKVQRNLAINPSSGTTHSNNLPCCPGDDPIGQLDRIQKMAQDIRSPEHRRRAHKKAQTAEPQDNLDQMEQQSLDHSSPNKKKNCVGNPSSTCETEDEDSEEKAPDEALIRIGIHTAIAIGLHNIPEGLATYVSALDDPAVGVVVAFATALHNIPEGLCVALPLYYATGNRWLAFGWALCSGLSEVLAALMAWAVLKLTSKTSADGTSVVMSDTTYAVLFGMVAGMMVHMSIREMLPTAHFYDPTDTVVSSSFVAGMVLMALSLILFVL